MALINDVGTGLTLTAQAASVESVSALLLHQWATGSAVELVAGSAHIVSSAFGSQTHLAVGTTVALLAQRATTFTPSGIVIEDIGTSADLVAQSALFSGVSAAIKVAAGVLISESAQVEGSGRPVRVAVGALLSASAQAYGVSERLIISGTANLTAQPGLLLALIRRNPVAAGVLLAEPAVMAGSGAFGQDVVFSLIGRPAVLQGVGGHSSPFGPVGAGDLAGDSASITNSTNVAKIASGPLYADAALFVGLGVKTSNSFGANLVSAAAEISVSTLAGDILTWEDDDAIWGQPAVIHARDYPVFPQGNIFYQADFGTTFDKEPVRVLLERTGLALLGRDRQGNWKINQGVIKFVSGVWPFLKGTPGSEVLIYVGSQNHPEEAVTWEGPYTAIIGETEFLDFTVSGRYLAVRFESIGQPPWELISYDLDLTTVGER